MFSRIYTHEIVFADTSLSPVRIAGPYRRDLNVKLETVRLFRPISGVRTPAEVPPLLATDGAGEYVGTRGNNLFPRRYPAYFRFFMGIRRPPLPD